MSKLQESMVFSAIVSIRSFALPGAKPVASLPRRFMPLGGVQDTARTIALNPESLKRRRRDCGDHTDIAPAYFLNDCQAPGVCGSRGGIPWGSSGGAGCPHIGIRHAGQKSAKKEWICAASFRRGADCPWVACPLAR